MLREIYTKLGLSVNQSEQSVELRRDNPLASVLEFDFFNTPDLLPAVAVTCAALGVEGRFTGVKNLRFKESNRLDSIAEGLAKLGRQVVVEEDSMTIPAGEPFTRESLANVGVIDSHDDHRIAMAFGALKVINPSLEVSNPDCVNKSFPDFWKMLQRLQ